MKVRFTTQLDEYSNISNLQMSLYAYLFAKQHHAKFITYVSDKSVDHIKSFINTIANKLNDKFQPDEIFIPCDMCQKKKYINHAMSLVKWNMAYILSDDSIKHIYSPGDIIKFKMNNDGISTINHSLYGILRFNCKNLQDIVLINEDGTPSNIFNQIVNDYYQEITHIVNNNDSFVRIIQYVKICSALGWKLPYMYHFMPIHNNYDIDNLRKYDIETVAYYLYSIGMITYGTSFMPLNRLIKEFNIEYAKIRSFFDLTNLERINKQYIEKMPLDTFKSEIYKRFGINLEDNLAVLLQKQIHHFDEVPIKLKTIFAPNQMTIESAKRVFLNKQRNVDYSSSLKILKDIYPYSGNIENYVLNSAIPRKTIMWPIRIALSQSDTNIGSAIELLDVLDNNEINRRFFYSINLLKKIIKEG